MNSYQTLQQMGYRVEAATWPDSPGAAVIGGSWRVVPQFPAVDVLMEIGFPYVLFQPGPSTPDRWNPRLQVVTGIMGIGVRVGGDMSGQASVIGGSRVSVGQSAGRGVLEVEEEVLGVLARMGDQDGVRVYVKYTGSTDTAVLDDGAMITERKYRISFMASTARSYYRPRNLAKSGDTVSWALPPDRFDRKRIRLFGKSGTTPPTYEEAGTEVTLGSDLATSVSDPQSAPYSYAVFCEYDENKDNASDPWLRNSEATTLVVT